MARFSRSSEVSARVIMSGRQIQREILDELPADDPRAIQSRRDLQKVNTFMGHPAMVAHELSAASRPPRIVVELGAGDGTFLLRVAKRLRHRPRVRALLVDRRPSLSDATRNGFALAGWDVDICESDVFEWLSRPSPQMADATVANLFLHHFTDGDLACLFTLASRQTTRFIACEPRRSLIARTGASLLRLVGCNEVTMHDAHLSVRAGFRDSELTLLWPQSAGWQLNERWAGLFSHRFVARHAHAV
jgi:Methyltransferase domain